MANLDKKKFEGIKIIYLKFIYLITVTNKTRVHNLVLILKCSWMLLFKKLYPILNDNLDILIFKNVFFFYVSQNKYETSYL